MPDFLLRYKLPKGVLTDIEVEAFRQRALQMARQAQAIASSNFFGWGVSYEVRPFNDNDGHMDFSVVGQVTDNRGKFKARAEKTQAEIQAMMQSLAYQGELVDCWWQRVRGVWDYGEGQMERPS